MKTKKTAKKFMLNKETVSNLNYGQMGIVRGAGDNNKDITTICFTADPYNSCTEPICPTDTYPPTGNTQ